VAHSVFVVDTVARVAASLNKVDRRAYDTAISGLKGEGCKAAGYRWAEDRQQFPAVAMPRYLLRDPTADHATPLEQGRAVLLATCEEGSGERGSQYLIRYTP
jgi:hypothetical protein